MIARVHQSMEKRDKGFTLVELLVVVVIIGILAAIAIPAFLRQRESAWRASVESDLKNASIAAENFSVSNNGLYTSATATLNEAALLANGFNKTEGVTITVSGVTGTEYTLTGDHAQLPDDATYNSTTGVITWP